MRLGRIVVPQRICDPENIEDEPLLWILLLDHAMLHRPVRLQDREKALLVRNELQREELRRPLLGIDGVRGEREREPSASPRERERTQIRPEQTVLPFPRSIETVLYGLVMTGSVVS